MKKLLIASVLASGVISTAHAQDVFTYGSDAVPVAEFLKVYQKNNAAKQVDFSDKPIREYVDLYALFKMKTKEARLQHIDTIATVEKEIANYRRQLTKGYLTDEQMVEKLVQEAYDRSKYEVKVAHICLMTSKGNDSVAAAKRIDSIYQLLSKGKGNFAKLAEEYSQDNGSKSKGGDLGYITALQTVYPFESVVYNTPVGKVSAPFRTPFGYHIVKVLDKRPARGTVRVAQILLQVPQSEGVEGMKAARVKMDSIQKAIKAGARFEEMVQKYSADKFTNNKDGELPEFGVGKMVPQFEDAAYALKNVGDISSPIETEFGVHLIKLLGKSPLKSFEASKKELRSKIDKDSRAQQARDLYFEKVKAANGYKEFMSNWNSFEQQVNKIPDTGEEAGRFTPNTFAGGKNVLFTLDGKSFTQDDFVNYSGYTTRGTITARTSKAEVFRELYKMYQNKVFTDFQEYKLMEDNPEFRSLMQEYEDGIMLFELMDQNVWSKANKDTAGLKTFYETQKENYKWNAGFRGVVYTFKDEASMKEGVKLLNKKGMDNETFLKSLNVDTNKDAVNIQYGFYEFDKYKDVSQAAIVKNKLTTPVKKENGSYVVVKAEEIYTTPTLKTFNEAKGYVVSSYQDKLEKDWNSNLKAKYPVKINEVELKKIIK